MEIWTIEVRDGAFSAEVWADSHRSFLTEAALTHGATDWRWVRTDWGTVLELEFRDEADWWRFRDTPAVRAALDAVPDPVNGLFVYNGPGGSSGVGHPRRPKPRPVAGAAEAPLPDPTPVMTYALSIPNPPQPEWAYVLA